MRLDCNRSYLLADTVKPIHILRKQGYRLYALSKPNVLGKTACNYVVESCLNVYALEVIWDFQILESLVLQPW